MITASVAKLISTVLAAGIAGVSGYEAVRAGPVSTAGAICLAALAILAIPFAIR